MTDRGKADMKLFFRTLLRQKPIVTGLAWFFVPIACFSVGGGPNQGLSPFLFLPFVAGLTAWCVTADSLKERYRFKYANYGHLWHSLNDRQQRFEVAYKRSPRVVKQTLSDTPESIRRIIDTMYMALQRADAVRTMISDSEPISPPFHLPFDSPSAHDEHAQVLYGIAERNKEEYRQHFRKLMGGVERTEAQVAVLLSSLDSLRLKMLDYRVTGGKVEMASSDLLSRLEGYRTEFQALEKAMDEVENEFVRAM